MVAGVTLFAAALALQADAALRSGDGTGARANGRATKAKAAIDKAGSRWLAAAGQLVAPWRPGSRLRVPTLHGWLAALAVVHAAGIFSFFYLLGEGKLKGRQAQSATAMRRPKQKPACSRIAWAATACLPPASQARMFASWLRPPALGLHWPRAARHAPPASP